MDTVDRLVVKSFLYREKIIYGIRFVEDGQQKQKLFLSKFISCFSAKRLKVHITSLLLNENEISEYSIREKVTSQFLWRLPSVLFF